MQTTTRQKLQTLNLTCNLHLRFSNISIKSVIGHSDLGLIIDINLTINSYAQALVKNREKVYQ